MSKQIRHTYNEGEISKVNPCKRCGCTEKVPITRIHPITKENYRTTRCKACAQSYSKKHYDAKGAKQHAQWQRDNAEHLREYQRNYYKNKYRVRNALHQKTLKQAMLKTEDNIKRIKEFYANTPKGMEVDHIYPLKGKTCSGLHVWWNLQYLPPSDNRSKSNKVSEQYQPTRTLS